MTSLSDPLRYCPFLTVLVLETFIHKSIKTTVLGTRSARNGFAAFDKDVLIRVSVSHCYETKQFWVLIRKRCYLGKSEPTDELHPFTKISKTGLGSEKAFNECLGVSNIFPSAA